MSNLRSMMSRCRAVFVVLLASLPGLVPVGPRAIAVASPARQLAGVTKIVGSEPGWMRLHLPADLDPYARSGSADRLPFETRGPGRVIAAILTQETEAGIGNGPSIYLWSLGRCGRRACETRDFRTTWMFPKNLVESGGRHVLPAGDYRLYLIADGGRAEMRINFPELDGTTTLTPRRDVRVDLRTLRPVAKQAEDEVAYWGGRRAPFGGSGFALAGLWVDGPETDSYAGSCIYEGRTPPPGNTAFIPPCPAADLSTLSYAGSEFNEFGYVNLGALPKAMGLWRSSDEAARRAGGVTVWMRF